MSEALPLLWSPAQQAWLQAMGYTVYHDGELAAEHDAALQLSVAQAAAAGAPPADMAAAPASARTAARKPLHAEPGEPVAPPSAPARRNPPAPLDPAPPTATPAPAMAAGNGRQPAVRLPDRLQIALLRASGCNPNDPATQALMESWPLQQLRRDPAAKRALWPQLRALRRQARG